MKVIFYCPLFSFFRKHSLLYPLSSFFTEGQTDKWAEVSSRGIFLHHRGQCVVPHILSLASHICSVMLSLVPDLSACSFLMPMQTFLYTLNKPIVQLHHSLFSWLELAVNLAVILRFPVCSNEKILHQIGHLESISHFLILNNISTMNPR